MNFLNRVKQIMVYADADPRELNRVTPEISDSNRRSIITFSIVAVSFLTIMTGLSFWLEGLQGSRILYSVCAVISAVVLLLAHGPAKNNEKLTVVIMYVFLGMLLMFGIILGTVTVPNEITATYIALLLTVPQMFTDRPWRFYALIACSVVVFVFMVLTHKAPVTWSSDIINSIVFGSVSAVCCTYMMKIKMARFCLVETVRYLAETDQLTGTRNRNSYENRVQNATLLAAHSVYCIYVDVNGLHELNNTQGHTAGDKMLCYVATVMQNIFGTKETYRIGGDEFVAFGVDKSAGEVETMIDRMRMAVEAGGYHIAVGMEHRVKDELGLDQLVREAETRMYQDKSDFYRQSGRDRRRR